MRAAASGRGPRRAPVQAVDNGDGTFDVIDGNATALAAARMGLGSVWAETRPRVPGGWTANTALFVEPCEGTGTRYETLGSLYLAAEKALPEFRRRLEAAAQAGGFTLHMRKGLKGRERSAQKLSEDYGGDTSQLLDVCGGTLALDPGQRFGDAVKELERAGFEIVRVKNLFIKGTPPSGYRNIKVNVRTPDGFTGEVILIERGLLEKKNAHGHAVYEEIRAAQGVFNAAPDGDAKTALGTLIKAMERTSAVYYGASNESYAETGAAFAAAAEALRAASRSTIAQAASSPRTVVMFSGAPQNILPGILTRFPSLITILKRSSPPGNTSDMTSVSMLYQKNFSDNLSPIATPLPFEHQNILPHDPAQVNDNDPLDIRYALDIEGPRRPIEKIRLMTSPAKLKSHPDYKVAKAGDSQAAVRVAAAVVKPDKIRALAADHPDAVLVPVRAEEAAGANQLPVALAGVIRRITGLEVDHGIVQSVRAHRTGKGRAYRMEHRPQFKGDAVAGREYILIDDMATMGGTLGELRHYIESRGGIVVDAVTLAAAQFGNVFGLTPQTEAGLLARAGVNYLRQFLKERGLYGGNWKYLSEGEGRAVLQALPPDGGRDGGVAGQGAGDAAIRGRSLAGDRGDDGHIAGRNAVDLNEDGGKYLSEGEGRAVLQALSPDGGGNREAAGRYARGKGLRERTQGRDSGDDGHRPVRYALDLTGEAYSKENMIVGYMAYADMTGGPFPSRAHVAALADGIKLKSHNYANLKQRARELAASRVDDAIRRAAASAAPDAAAFAIGELARAAERRALVRAGAAEGARLARSGERIRALAESGVAAAMRAQTGADYADLKADTGIDLAASLLAADPKTFGPEEARKRDEAAGVILPDPFAGEGAERVETDEDAPGLTDAQRAEIARKRRERESRAESLIEEAAPLAAAQRARDEVRRRRKAESAETEGTAADGDAGGGDGASGTDAAADPVADALAADPALPVDLSDRWQAAAMLRVWAFRRFRRENPLSRDTRGNLTKNRVAVSFYRKTAARQLTDLARKLLEPGAPRESIRVQIAEIQDYMTANQIERRTAYIIGLINRHAIREDQRSRIAKFKKEIKRQYIKGKEFEELGVDIDRTLTGAVEEDARYVMRVCDLSDESLDGSPSALEKERARIEAVIAEREGMTDEQGNPLNVGGDDMQLRRALRQLALLDKYGAMVDMMPGEIADLTGEALASLGQEALDLAARWQEYDRLVKSIKDPVVRSISRKPTDPKAADTVLNRIADSSLSMLRQKLDFLTRYEADPAKREEARAAIADLMNLLAEGHTAYVNARADDRAALMKALGEILKKPDGRPDRRAIRAYLRRLDEKIPHELAVKLSLQGNQDSMTYGQMLNLLGYLDQWASYSENIVYHGRCGQAELIRSFVYEAPKTGEVRRALTSEDTQLLEWLRRSYYARKRDVISNVTRRLCGRGVDSPDPLYLPMRMLFERTASLNKGARDKNWQPLAGVFSRRRKHKLDVDESASILDMFENRSHETAVLTAFGARGLVIREVLTSRAFQDAVRRFHGEKTLSRILRQVAQSLDGGRAQGGGQSAAAALAQRAATYVYLGFNVTSAVKQTASLPVFAARMGFRNLGKILFSPIDRDAIRTLREADHHRARYGTGPASGMSAADREAYSGYDTSPPQALLRRLGACPHALGRRIRQPLGRAGRLPRLPRQIPRHGHEPRRRRTPRGLRDLQPDRRDPAERPRGKPSGAIPRARLGRPAPGAVRHQPPAADAVRTERPRRVARPCQQRRPRGQHPRGAEQIHARRLHQPRPVPGHDGPHDRAPQKAHRRRARLGEGRLLGARLDIRDHGAVQARLPGRPSGRAGPARFHPAPAALHRGAARPGRGHDPLRGQRGVPDPRHRDLGHGALPGRHHADTEIHCAHPRSRPHL